MWIGALLICIGILVLMNNMDIIRGDVWNYIWPLALVFLGISMIFKKSRRDHRGFWGKDRDDHPRDQFDPPRT